MLSAMVLQPLGCSATTGRGEGVFWGQVVGGASVGDDENEDDE